MSCYFERISCLQCGLMPCHSCQFWYFVSHLNAKTYSSIMLISFVSGPFPDEVTQRGTLQCPPVTAHHPAEPRSLQLPRAIPAMAVADRQFKFRSRDHLYQTILWTSHPSVAGANSHSVQRHSQGHLAQCVP